ncbi:MAG: hypothetical protein M3081_15270 [Gemmatimonadota bacterium]|nr:hypothetical protein [Gemmatimonadota bacterium]
MSTIGYTSGQIEQKQRLLDLVNHAVLALQADALGMRETLHLDEPELQESRSVACRFATDVERALEGQSADPLIHALVLHVAATAKPSQDWIEDLRALRNALVHIEPVPTTRLAVLSELVRLFDREFTEDLFRMYGRR